MRKPYIGNDVFFLPARDDKKLQAKGKPVQAAKITGVMNEDFVDLIVFPSGALPFPEQFVLVHSKSGYPFAGSWSFDIPVEFSS